MEIFESTQSWIMALGKTLVHSLWIGILFVTVLKLSFIIIASRNTRWRYRIASLLLFLFAGSITGMFIMFYAPLAGTEVFASGTGIRLPVFYQISRGPDLLKICCYYSTYIYMAGLLFYLFQTALSLNKIRAIRKRGQEVETLWLDRFSEMMKKTETRAKVVLLESDQIDTPFLSGFIRPAIIIPAGMLSHLPFSQVETILFHELFHLKRLDHLVNLFQRIIEILFFYNPATWIISRSIRKERELCCDDLVLKLCPQPLNYARALYQLALEQSKHIPLVPAATGNHRGHLQNRIQRILNPSIMKTNIKEKLGAILLLTGTLLVVVVLSGFSSAFSITRYHDNPEEVLSKPIHMEPVAAVQPVAPAEPELPAPPAARNEPDTIPDQSDIEAMEAARAEALESIDWDEIKKEMEQAKIEAKEAMESIDWEAMKEDMESARLEAMESIDWEEIKKEIEQAKVEAKKAMESIDWEEIKKDMEKEMEKSKIDMDSLMKDFDFDIDLDNDFDFDFDFEFDFGFDFEEEVENIRQNIEELQKELEITESLDF